MTGKSNTSCMLIELVRSMTNLSIPSPHPPVGGSPCSKHLTKSVSRSQASSSPSFFFYICFSNSSFWMNGSLSSVYELTNSFWLINISNLSVNPFLFLWYLAKGHMICGWSIKNVGLSHYTSRYSDISLSSNQALVLGAEQGILSSLQRSSSCCLASSVSKSYGSFLFKIISNSSTTGILLQGLEKSISFSPSLVVILNFKEPLICMTISHNSSSVISIISW